MEATVVQKLVIEHLEQTYKRPHTEICLGGKFDLKFVSEELSIQKYNHHATWIASFYLDLTELEETRFTEFFPVLIEIYLDDKTGEIWTPFDPYKKLTPQEKRAARKKRRQMRRQTRKNPNT